MRGYVLPLAMLVLTAGPTWAQSSGECTGDSTDPACGAPEQTGGACGCGGGSILINFTDQGDSYQYADDFDDDGLEDTHDNCPFFFNADQVDGDGDGFGDACDFCSTVPAPLEGGVAIQRDTDADGTGDECDDDADGDGVENASDNCALVINPSQTNTDGNDDDGDACDQDDDNDGCSDASDNCPLEAATNCTEDLAIVPDLCFPDQDADLVADARDNCVAHPNIDQSDTDGDGFGDACDQDLDNDGIDNRVDNCVQTPNVEQRNEDRDSLGDACDPKLCYVVDGDEQGCLDPVAPFTVKASLADQRRRQVQTGDEVLLHIFANREDTPIRYTWAVVDQPSDGNAVISRPAGGVFFSQGIQYVYEADRTVRFSATTPGVYKLDLLAELAFDDSLGYDVKTARSQVTIEVGGARLSSCDHTGGLPWAGAGLVGALLLRRRRRPR
jgi:hypothetical protein